MDRLAGSSFLAAFVQFCDLAAINVLQCCTRAWRDCSEPLFRVLWQRDFQMLDGSSESKSSDATWKQRYYAQWLTDRQLSTGACWRATFNFDPQHSEYTALHVFRDRFALGTTTGCVQLWQFADQPRRLRELRASADDAKPGNNAIWTLQLRVDDIIVGHRDGALRQWSTHSGELLREFFGHSSTVVELDANGDRLVSAASSTLLVWSMHKPEAPELEIDCSKYGNIAEFDVDAERQLLAAVVLATGSVVLLSLADGSILRHFDAVEDASCVCFSPFSHDHLIYGGVNSIDGGFHAALFALPIAGGDPHSSGRLVCAGADLHEVRRLVACRNHLFVEYSDKLCMVRAPANFSSAGGDSKLLSVRLAIDDVPGACLSNDGNALSFFDPGSNRAVLCTSERANDCTFMLCDFARSK